MIGAAALLAGVLGCAAEAKLYKRDATFTAAALSAGGLAVVSVVKKEEVEQVRPPLIAALERTLGQERPELRLVPADRVSEDLGLETYRRILRAYQVRGTLDSSAVRTLARELGGEARYAVLGRVFSDAVRTSERGIPRQDKSEYRYFDTMLVTGRDARVDLRVYDLAKEAVVFHAQYVGSAEEARPARYGLEGGGAGSGTVALPSGPRDGVPSDVPDSLVERGGQYPAVPPLATALEEAFRAFAADLPK
jgi:hypothetical protein